MCILEPRFRILAALGAACACALPALGDTLLRDVATATVVETPISELLHSAVVDSYEVAAGATSRTSRSELRELPTGPGSTVLFMWALGSAGLWQLGRSARKVHFDSVPDWYHAGGRVQIGHRYVLEFDQLFVQAIATLLSHCDPPKIEDGRLVLGSPPQSHLPASRSRGPPLGVC